MTGPNSFPADRQQKQKSVRADPAAKPLWHQPLIVLFCAAALGILGDRWLQIPLGISTLGCGAAWTLWLCGFSLRWDRWAAVPLLCSLCPLAAAWHHWQWSLFPQHELGTFAGEHAEPVCLAALVTAEPLRQDAPPPDTMRTIPVGDSTSATLRVFAIRDGVQWRKTSGKSTLIVDGHLLGVHVGDRVQIFGQLALPTRTHNPGEFDRAAHERADRIHSIVRSGSPDCVAVLAPREAWSFAGWASRSRQAGAELLRKHLTDEQARLAAALLLGDKDQLGDEPVEAFFTTGMLHVLVVSGLHVGILAGCLLFLGSWGLLPRRTALLLVMGTIIFYALLTGGRPPAIRAATLISICCFAQLIGRRAISGNTLAFSALVVLAINPAELFRTGPQLSFLAVSVLIFISRWRPPLLPSDPLDRLIHNSRPAPIRALRRVKLRLIDVFGTTLAVWLLVTPLAMVRFHLFSPVGLILGPLLWLPVLGAMISGFLLLSIGYLLPLLAGPLGWVCGVCLDLIMDGIQWGASLPGSFTWVAGPGMWWILGLYLLLVWLAAIPQWRPPRRWCGAIMAVWIAVGMLPTLWRSSQQELRVNFISVQHGLSVLVEFPDGRNMLYDAGRIGSPYSPARSIGSVLWSRGITHLDAVVISHADADHYNAIPELLERFSVGVMYVSPMMFERDTPALSDLQERILAAGVPIREIWAGDRLGLFALAEEDQPAGEQFSQVPQLEVLHPPRQGVLGSDNSNSLVLELMYAGRRVLLTGDLEDNGLHLVMQESPRPTDVLLAPHHGSVRSDPPGFAAWSTPKQVVISGGDERGTQQVTEAYESAGAEVLHTNVSGAVTVIVQPDGRLEVRTFR